MTAPDMVGGVQLDLLAELDPPPPAARCLWDEAAALVDQWDAESHQSTSPGNAEPDRKER